MFGGNLRKKSRGNCRIFFKSVIIRTADAMGLNKNIVLCIRTVEDVINWQKKPGDSVMSRENQKYLTIFLQLYLVWYVKCIKNVQVFLLSMQHLNG